MTIYNGSTIVYLHNVKHYIEPPGHTPKQHYIFISINTRTLQRYSLKAIFGDGLRYNFKTLFVDVLGNQDTGKKDEFIDLTLLNLVATKRASSSDMRF